MKGEVEKHSRKTFVKSAVNYYVHCKKKIKYTKLVFRYQNMYAD